MKTPHNLHTALPTFLDIKKHVDNVVGEKPDCRKWNNRNPRFKEKEVQTHGLSWSRES